MTTDRWAEAERFSVSDAHRIVADLKRTKMRIYWSDLVASAIASWLCLAAVVVIRLPVWGTVGLFLASVLLMYRAIAFIHEIAHFDRRSGFRTFRIAWNALVGIPMLLPSFLYEMHSEHHSKKLYATERDAEYRTFAELSRVQMVITVAAGIFAPLFGPWRFGILGPVSWAFPPARDFVYRQMSTLKIDLDYRGEPPQSQEQRRRWLVLEALCTVFVWSVAIGVVSGYVPFDLVLWWAALLAAVAIVNSTRLLGAHRYELNGGGEVTLVEQMLDSVNHPRHRLFAELWGPVGLRLHALHHLAPNLPYHALPEAHRRLAERLPADSAYHLTSSPGLRSSIARVWQSAKAYRQRHSTELRGVTG